MILEKILRFDLIIFFFKYSYKNLQYRLFVNKHFVYLNEFPINLANSYFISKIEKSSNSSSKSALLANSLILFLISEKDFYLKEN